MAIRGSDSLYEACAISPSRPQPFLRQRASGRRSFQKWLAVYFQCRSRQGGKIWSFGLSASIDMRRNQKPPLSPVSRRELEQECRARGSPLLSCQNGPDTPRWWETPSLSSFNSTFWTEHNVREGERSGSCRNSLRKDFEWDGSLLILPLTVASGPKHTVGTTLSSQRHLCTAKA